MSGRWWTAALALLTGCAPDGGNGPADPVRSRYTSEVRADMPIAYWRLEEGSGTVASDSSGFGRHGTYVVGPTRGTIVSSALGFGMTLSPGISGDGMTVPYGDWMEFTDATVEVWARPNAIVSVNGVLLASQGTAWMVNIARDGTPLFGYPGGAAARGTEPLVIGRLYHLVGTFTAGTPGYLRLHVNGELVREWQTGPRLPHDPGGLFYVGRGVGNGFDFNGMVDEIALYDKALPAERIRAHYEAGR